jgi:hypothetical protein
MTDHRPQYVLTVDDLWASSIPEPNSGCWLWMGYVNPKGYGRTKDVRMAHRVALELKLGRKLMPGHESDHLCRVRCCVNGDHLEEVTHLENLRRGNGILTRLSDLMAKKTHCPYGHPYSGDNLYIRKEGRRECRTCMRERNRRRCQ